MSRPEKPLERQSTWQKNRSSLSWAQKIRAAEAIRESIAQFRRSGRAAKAERAAVIEKIAGAVGFYAEDGRQLGQVRVGNFPHETALSEDGRLLYVGDNVTNAINLVRAAIENDVRRFVLSSTCAVFGVPPDDIHFVF